VEETHIVHHSSIADYYLDHIKAFRSRLNEVHDRKEALAGAKPKRLPGGFSSYSTRHGSRIGGDMPHGHGHGSLYCLM
jgi:hypothetical protein